MALLSSAIRTTLNGYSFTREFLADDQAYLDVARLVAKNVRDTLQKAGAQPTLNTLNDEEIFADVHLVDKVAFWFLADNAFPCFRRALRRGIRKNIPPVDYWAWGEMMARYVLQEAITRRVLI